MSTVNTEYFSEQNRRLARLINDFGELLSREDFKAYQEVVLSNICVDKKHNEKDDEKLSEQEQKEFLLKIYNIMIDKFRKINFDHCETNDCTD